MPVFKSDPLDIAQWHAEVVGQNTPNPGDRGLRMRTNTDALAVQLGDGHTRPFSVVHQTMVLKTAGTHHRRHQGEGFTVSFGLQKSYQGEFGHIEFEITHHAFERSIGHFDIGKIKRKQRRHEAAVFNGSRVRIVA